LTRWWADVISTAPVGFLSRHGIESLETTVNSLLALAALAHASGPVKDPPLIDLDSTVFIQLVVFIITALVLSRFLFRPFLAMRAQRHVGIEGAREEAGRMDDQAKAQIADYDTRFAKAKSKANDERAKVRNEAAERERVITDAARKETDAAIESARQTLGTEAATARKSLEPRAQEIARSIAQKVLGREVA
jgi:F0F1-type ATP synthase membrane subunit b/b'